MWMYPEVRTLGDLTAYYARNTPNARALSFEGRETTWAQFEKRANQFANMLIAHGICPKENVAFLGKNSDDFFVAMFGAVKAGAAFAPLNWRLAPSELERVLLDSAPHFIVAERDYEPLLPDWGTQRKPPILLIIDDQKPLSATIKTHPGETPPISISEDDVGILLYTSGTTSNPKGVMLTHGGFNRMRLLEHLEQAFHWEADDKYLFNVPNFHLLGIGLSLQCLYNGIPLIIQRRFDPKETLRAIGMERPTLLVMTPSMIQMLLDHPLAQETDFSSLRLTMYAGSPIALGLIKRAVAAMPCKFMQFYGATESAGAMSLLRPEEHDLSNEANLKSCGRPLPLISFRIVDSNGNELPDGQAGELVVHSPAIFGGYWRNKAGTSAVLKNGWYATGDIAVRDEQGLYHLVDRAKDMIVTGGENVYSAEVESALSLHPSVASVAVIGVPDPRWGEAIKAFVVPQDGVEIEMADLMAHCRRYLASYKTPKSIEVVLELPMTATGKISKKDLRAKFWTEDDRVIG